MVMWHVFLMDSPSWPWQISVVPIEPSTNRAFLLVSFGGGERGGQRECTARCHTSSHKDILYFIETREVFEQVWAKGSYCLIKFRHFNHVVRFLL